MKENIKKIINLIMDNIYIKNLVIMKIFKIMRPKKKYLNFKMKMKMMMMCLVYQKIANKIILKNFNNRIYKILTMIHKYKQKIY